MTTDLTELDGVAEGRAENLTEAGYESVEDLVDADPEEVADEVSYLPEDTALELVVQAQNIVAEEDAEVEESQPVTKEVADAVDSADEPDSASENVAEAVEEVDDSEEAEETLEKLPDEEEFEEEFEDDDADETDEQDDADSGEPESASETTPDEIAFELTFDEELEYDTFFDAVMGQRATMLRSNRTGVDAFDHALDEMRAATGAGETISLEMESGQLNDLHNCVRQTMIAYKGDNLIDHMDALKAVLNDINEVRDEHLF